MLSVPFELRLLLARDHRALSAVGRIFVREVFHWQREQAALAGISGARSGAVCFPQRFGGSLNVNVHSHVAVPDGVFTTGESDVRAGFHALARPSHDDLDTIALNVEMRVTAWLARRGLLVEQSSDSDGAPRERSALEACLEASLGIGELTALPKQPATRDEDLGLPAPTKAARSAGCSRGFDVHAGVVVSASDRDGRERLLRYCARPPLSLERLSRLPDGRIAYALRKPWGKQTHRVMHPVQFLARLAALIPPPRRPLVRFHGVLAPHSAWRSMVVPAPRTSGKRDGRVSCVSNAGESAESDRERPAACGARASLGTVCSPSAVKKRRRSDPPAEVCAGTERFTFGRIDWAALLKRVYDVDALACPCGGRLRFISFIDDAEVARAILESLGLPSVAPPIARARSPDVFEPSPSDTP